MKLTIMAHANIRHYFPDKNELQETEVEDNITVGTILNRYDIPESEIMLVLVNKNIATKDHILKENDCLEIFPVLCGG